MARNGPPGDSRARDEQFSIDNPSEQPFAFVDFERQNVLLLALGFGLLVGCDR